MNYSEITRLKKKIKFNRSENRQVILAASRKNKPQIYCSTSLVLITLDSYFQSHWLKKSVNKTGRLGTQELTYGISAAYFEFVKLNFFCRDKYGSITD